MTTNICETARPDVTCGAVVYFPGAEPPTLADLRAVERRGVRVEMIPATDGDRFAARLTHPIWGDAYVASPRPAVRPVPHEVQVAPWLTRREKERIAGCRASLLLICVPSPAGGDGSDGGDGGAALRDSAMSDDPDPAVERKRLFHFARALCGERAAGILDASSGRHWSPEGLDDELAHEAPLDVESRYLVHAVTDAAEFAGGMTTDPAALRLSRQGRITWFHTHGLAEAGAFDIDIVLPSRSILATWGDPLRGLAALALDGVIEPGMTCYPLGNPGGDVAFVTAERWELEAPYEERLLRQDGGNHRTDRVVVCDPLVGPAAGGGESGAVRYSRFLANVDLGATVFSMSRTHAVRSAIRARSTIPRLAATIAEFGPFIHDRWLTLEVDTEDGMPGRERLSFVLDPAETARGESVRAVLVDTPMHVASVRPGDAGLWPVAAIADWRLDTPVGPVSPRSAAAVRILRDERERLIPLLRCEEQRVAGRRSGREGWSPGQN